MITIKKYSKPGCTPCVILSNYLSDIHLAEHDAELIEINTADLTEGELDALNLSGVPTLTYSRNGVEVIDRTVGLISTEEIIENIALAKAVR